MAGRASPLPGPTAIIAEDEAILQEELRTRLALLWPDLRIVGSAANGADALAMFDRHRPQIMFLDIEMPGLSGLQVARQVADRCHVVFLTAYDAYAVDAFEQGAIDYLLKPYDTERLGAAVRRVKSRLDASPPPLTELLRDLTDALQPKTYLNWIRASRGADVELIMVADVCFLRADTKYTSVFTADREALIRRAIKDLAAELDPSRFWQIHRSTIVNVEAISVVQRSLTGAMTLKLKKRIDKLPVSESYRHLFRHM